jgi:hypothetical protein
VFDTGVRAGGVPWGLLSSRAGLRENNLVGGGGGRKGGAATVLWFHSDFAQIGKLRWGEGTSVPSEGGQSRFL